MWMGRGGGSPCPPAVICLDSGVRPPSPCLVPGPALGVGWGRLGSKELGAAGLAWGHHEVPSQGHGAVLGQGQAGWLTCPSTPAPPEDAGEQH